MPIPASVSALEINPLIVASLVILSLPGTASVASLSSFQWAKGVVPVVSVTAGVGKEF